MDNDLISREALKEALAREIKTNDMGLWLKILLVIDNVQAVESRQQGEWIDTKEFDEYWGNDYKCSHCGGEVLGCDAKAFCPNCGADMREAEE